MLFRPTYCCNCGDKIERAQWRFWTSRRFCELCESVNKPFDLGSRGVVILGGLISLFWLGNFIVPSTDAQPKAENVRITSVQNDENGRQKLRTLKEGSQTVDKASEKIAEDDLVSAKESSPLTLSAKQNESPERVYICGARTKKDTACSRRVKVQGSRCFQHRGMPAMKDEVSVSDKISDKDF